MAEEGNAEYSTEKDAESAHKEQNKEIIHLLDQTNELFPSNEKLQTCDVD